MASNTAATAPTRLEDAAIAVCGKFVVDEVTFAGGEGESETW